MAIHVTWIKRHLEATRKILSLGDWFEPMTVKAEIEALKKFYPSPRPDLIHPNHSCRSDNFFKNCWKTYPALTARNNQLDGGLFTDLNSIKIEHLTLFKNNLAEIIAPPEIKESMDAVVPANLQELLEAQAKVTAEKSKLWVGRHSLKPKLNTPRKSASAPSF